MKKKYGMRAAQALTLGAIAVCMTAVLPLSVSAQQAADADITSAINTELWVDNAVSANNIDISTTDGIVTLTGTANNILAKERAQALAEATVGVRAIINRIAVKPVTPRSDDELETAVEDAWLYDPVARSYKIEADVDDGIVTISGTVDSYAEKDISATVAKGVRGAKGIVNEITVDNKVTRSDMQIQYEVIARLENDVRVDDALINVKVNNGKLSLTGTVGSLQEKTQARSDAWVASRRLTATISVSSHGRVTI